MICHCVPANPQGWTEDPKINFLAEKGLDAYQSGHSKIDKTNILITNGSLMKVESIEECSRRGILQYFDLHYAIIGLENQSLVFFRVAVLHRFYCRRK